MLPYRETDVGEKTVPNLNIRDDVELFRTKDLDQAHDFLAKKVSPHRLEVVEDIDSLDVHYRGLVNESISLMRIGYGARVKAQPKEYRNLFFAQTIMRGSNRISRGSNEVDLLPNQSMMLSPESPYDMDICDSSERLVIGINKDILQRHLETLLFEEISSPLIFSTQIATQQASHIWQNHISNVAQIAFSMNGNVRRNQMLISYLESTMTTALCVFDHNYSDRLSNDPIDGDSTKMRRALDYIHENVRENPTLSDIAKQSGVSGRSLQLLFRRRFNQTPLEYFRTQRLHAVKTDLEMARQGTRVTDIMLDYGITSFGHFSKQYKDIFGCCPRESLPPSCKEDT